MIVFYISIGFEYIGKCLYFGILVNMMFCLWMWFRYESEVFCVLYMNMCGNGRLRNLCIRLLLFDRLIIEWKMLFIVLVWIL